MPIFYALIAIAVLTAVIGLSLIILRARGSLPTKRRPPTRYHVAFSLTTTLALVIVWIVYDLSFAILPALIMVQWIPLMTRNDRATPNRKLLLVSLFAGAIGLVVGTGLFWMLRS